MKVYAILEYKHYAIDKTQYMPVVCNTFEELRQTLASLRECNVFSSNGDNFYGRDLKIGDFYVHPDSEDWSIIDEDSISLSCYFNKQEKGFFIESLNPNIYQIKGELLEWFNDSQYEGMSGTNCRNLFAFLQVKYPASSKELRQITIIKKSISLGHPSEEYMYYLLELVNQMYQSIQDRKK